MFVLPELNGNLIVLRQLNIERDTIGYFNVSRDEKIHLWVDNTIPENSNEIKELLSLYNKKMYVWTIFDKCNSDIIGIMRLSHPEIINGKKSAGDSQRLHSDYWRKGYMKEARKLIYEYAFENMKIETLFADVWEGNINSLESLKSVGYRIIDKEMEYFKKKDALNLKYYLELDLREWYENNVINRDKD